MEESIEGKFKKCLDNSETKKERISCVRKHSLKIGDNPYVKFRDKYDNPIDNAIIKEREERVIEEDERREHMFHTTEIENISSIAKEGLVVEEGHKHKWKDSFPAIFTSEFPEHAIKWQIRHLTLSAPRHGKPEIYTKDKNISIGLLRIDKAACGEGKYGEDWKYDEIGSTSEYGESWYCKESIPPEHIDVRVESGWYNIENLR